jgi:hypothetical protein
VRALGVGMIGVLLGLHLAALPLDAASIGIVVSAGLAGGALRRLLVTARGRSPGPPSHARAVGARERRGRRSPSPSTATR